MKVLSVSDMSPLLTVTAIKGTTKNITVVGKEGNNNCHSFKTIWY
jgi:hypothetical protein